MAWTVRIDFQDGSGWRDITTSVKEKSFKRHRVLWKELKPAIDNLTFKLRFDQTIAGLLFTTSGEILINVQKDGSDFFTGILRDTYKSSMRTRPDWMQIEAVDLGIRLSRKKMQPSSEALYTNYTLSDPTDKPSSLLHQLLYQAGVDDADIDVTAIAKTIPYFVHAKSDKTYWQVFESLLFEFGYVFYHDESGKFRLYNFLPTDTTTSNAFTNSNTIGELQWTKTKEKYEGVQVEWHELETLTDVVVFSETQGGDNVNKCEITVGVGEYYPANSDSREVFADYRLDNRDVVVVQSASLETITAGSVSQDFFTPYYKKAKFRFSNSGPDPGYIYKLDIVGDAVVKGTLNVTKRLNVADTDKLLKITAEHITSQTDSEKLSDGVARYYEYADFRYELQSRADYSLGAFADIEESHFFSIDNRCVIVERVDLAETEEIEYALEGISEYSLRTVETEGTITASPPSPQEQNSADALEGRPTYDELNGDGWTNGTGTTTPSVPVINNCYGIYEGIVLEWDKQLTLTNFDRYEVQVSSDQVSWYALQFDGTDWKDGTAGGDTNWYTEFLVHPRIPFGSATDANGDSYPVGVTLYYRVRRVTRLGEASSWSTAASATTKAVEDGTVGLAAIKANNIETGVLEALVALIRDSITISDDTGFTGQSTDRQRKVYINSELIRFSEYIDSAWSVLREISARKDTGEVNFSKSIIVGRKYPTSNLLAHYGCNGGVAAGEREWGTSQIVDDSSAEFGASTWALTRAEVEGDTIQMKV